MRGFGGDLGGDGRGNWGVGFGLQLGDETVAEGGDGLDVTGLFGVVIETLAQLADDAVEYVVGDEGFFPDRVNELMAGDEDAWAFGQKY